MTASSCYEPVRPYHDHIIRPRFWLNFLSTKECEPRHFTFKIISISDIRQDKFISQYCYQCYVFTV